jgi:hypothetical protein
MIGHDPHDIADIGAGVAAREVEKAVLFGKSGDFCFRTYIYNDRMQLATPAATCMRSL